MCCWDVKQLTNKLRVSGLFQPVSCSLLSERPQRYFCTGTTPQKSCFAQAQHHRSLVLHRHNTTEVLFCTGTTPQKSCFAQAQHHRSLVLHRHNTSEVLFCTTSTSQTSDFSQAQRRLPTSQNLALRRHNVSDISFFIVTALQTLYCTRTQMLSCPVSHRTPPPPPPPLQTHLHRYLHTLFHITDTFT